MINEEEPWLVQLCSHLEDHSYLLLLIHRHKEEPNTESQQISAEIHVMRNTAKDCLEVKTSDEKTVTKLPNKHDFRCMLEHCQPTLEHFCTLCSQYEYNCIITLQTINFSCIHVKNECLSQNSTCFEFMVRLQISCFQLLHVNDLLEVVTENLFHWVLLLILHQNYCIVIRNLSGQVYNVKYCNNWCYDGYINLNNCNVVDTVLIRVYYNVRHFRTSKYTYICTQYFNACLINKAYTRAQQILGARAPECLEILQ